MASKIAILSLGVAVYFAFGFNLDSLGLKQDKWAEMTEEKHRIDGFDREFDSLDHYIRVITHRIWEEGRIEDIRLYYSDPCIVETPSSVSTSIEDVIWGTKATLGMFPDRQLLAEDIISSGNSLGGFLSSHRIISPMTHCGDGMFGAATGRKIYVRTIADCVCRENRIIHEWLVRDQAAIAIQLGLEPRALAQKWLNERGGWAKPVAGPAPDGYVSEVSDAPIALAYIRSIEELAVGNDKGAREIYDSAVQQSEPGGQVVYGRDDVLAFWSGLFSALGVEEFSVEHLAFQIGGGRPARLATRWRAKTSHRGEGRYGASTGKPVELLAICHAEFVEGRVIREWVLIDDIAIWMQVLRESEQ